MATFQSTLMLVFFLTIALHISLLCGVISLGTDFQGSSTAVTVREGENGVDGEDDGDGMVMTEEEEILEVFEPTEEWQTIKEGQAIPAGLHIRINLATGQKEAKLLDEDETPNPSNERSTTDSEEGLHTKEDLKRRLAKMNGEEECDEGETDNEALIEEVKKRYRTIEEIKKEFAELKLNVETDYDIMTRLVKEYRENASTERRKLVLQDLEYYVHQVDNAVDLERLGGWDIIVAALNSTEEEMHGAAAHVLGSAVQSNPKAQIMAIERGAIQVLVRLLAQSPSTVVQKRALYGISALVRFFPFAQQKFLDLGGLSVLSGLMRDGDVDKLPVRVKSMTLLHDLLVEQRDILSSHEGDDDDMSIQKKSQYEKINLVQQMVSQGWCDFVPTLLSVPDHDTREKVLLSVEALISDCKQYGSNSLLRNSLKSLSKDYHTLAEEESLQGEGDDYFSGLSQLVDRILDKVHS